MAEFEEAVASEDGYDASGLDLIDTKQWLDGLDPMDTVVRGAHSTFSRVQFERAVQRDLEQRARAEERRVESSQEGERVPQRDEGWPVELDDDND